ncbi:MAG TPA: PQQ-binding-like beta-propeller repeat protein [Chthoniobacteraceae bacterium]|jgi:hypothetical protein|nr:PQQ-binding-like beta-propeller repeat protein [Chthoniobacteraceae bacterium]
MWLLRLIAVSVLLFLGGGAWYYCMGRHPHVMLSHPIGEKDGAPICARVAPGEMVMLAGDTATLFDTAAGLEKWTVKLNGGPAAAAPAVTAPPADPRVAKLTAWRDELTRRRPTLKPGPETLAFNEEAARYHAELALFRGQAAPSAPAAPAVKAPAIDHEEEMRQKRLVRETERLRKKGENVAQMSAVAKTAFQLETAKARKAEYEAELAAFTGERKQAETKKPAPAPPADREDEESVVERYFHERAPAQIVTAGPSIWVIRNREAIGLQRANGQLVKRVALTGPAQHAWAGVTQVYVLAGAGEASQIVSIGAADGTACALAVAGRYAPERADYTGAPQIQARRAEFAVSGNTLLQLDARLLEKKVTEHQAMKGSSTDDWEKADREGKGGWANDAALIGQAMENDAKREMTGGVERIDESSYEVAITRPFEKTPAFWTGKVTGRPELFALATLNLLICGTEITALDRDGKQLWQAKLAWGLPAVDTPPCLETAGTVYLFDRAFLTALQRETGKVLWRLPSVGIQKLLPDGDGALYVCTQNAPAETARFSQEAHGAGAVPCSVLKVDGRTGKVLWNAPKYEDCFAAGGAVYAVREAKNPNDAVDAVFTHKAPVTRFMVFKLGSGSGKPQWEYLQLRRPLQIEPEGRKIALLFADEFQALSSLAL